MDPDIQAGLDDINLRLARVELDLQTIYRDIQHLLQLTRLINGQLPEAPAASEQ